MHRWTGGALNWRWAADAPPRRTSTVVPASAGPDKRLPFVLFVPGDAPQPIMEGLLDWGQYRAWGEAVAARGLAAVVAKHASTDGSAMPPRSPPRSATPWRRHWAGR